MVMQTDVLLCGGEPAQPLSVSRCVPVPPKSKTLCPRSPQAEHALCALVALRSRPSLEWRCECVCVCTHTHTHTLTSGALTVSGRLSVSALAALSSVSCNTQGVTHSLRGGVSETESRSRLEALTQLAAQRPPAPPGLRRGLSAF